MTWARGRRLRSDWWSASRRRWDTSIRTSHGGGLRGAPALTLALSLPADLPLRDDILISAFGVVAFSVIVQGLTAPFALRALGLTPRSGTGARLAP